MKLRVPHTFTIIFILIAIMAALTWVIPSGKYARIHDSKSGKELVIPNSYKAVPANPQGVKDVLQSFAKGMLDASDIIVFLLIIGGAYGVVLETGALDTGFKKVITKLGNKDKLLIPMVLFLFAIGGTVTGMWEETLAFYMLIVPLVIAMGYDALVGAGAILIGAAIGNMSSITNPFSTGIASGIANVSLSDGMGIRCIMWVVAVAVAIIYVMLYATKVKKDPKKSLLYSLRADHKKHFGHLAEDKLFVNFTLKHKIIVAAFIFNIMFMVFSIVYLDWWVIEITMQFIVLAVFCGYIAGMNEKQIWDNFVKGGQDFLFAAYVIGLARGVYSVAHDGAIVDTMLYYLSTWLANLPEELFLLLNQIAQLIVGFFVPSSSGHAALVIPILSPMAEILNVPKASIIITYTVASGLVNLVTPVAGVLMGALAICRIPFSAWLRFVIPIFLIEVAIGFVFVVISAYML
ncbi:YfcC family protein [Candidatus Hepatincola sp. Av]